MHTRKVGPFDVSAIGLGCMSLSHGYGPIRTREQSEAVLLGALDAGYTFFDTAALYGLGHNETLVGEVLGPHRDRFVLASKCGATVGGVREINGDPAVLKATCEASLRNLKTDVIDLYYLHRWDRRVPIEDSVGALADLVAEGTIRAIGLSEVSGETLRLACAAAPIAALQSEYSPWTRNAELGGLQACRELGVAYVAFSPVGRGMLAGGLTDPAQIGPPDFRSHMPRFQGEAFTANARLAQAFAGLAREAGCTPAQLCLAWLLDRDPIVVPIPGTADPDHMRENAAAADIRLPPGIAAKIDALVTPATVAGPRYNATQQSTVDTERAPGEA